MALKAKLAKHDNENLKDAMREIERENRQRLNVDVPASKYKALKIKATEEGITISQLVNRWVENYLNE